MLLGDFTGGRYLSSRSGDNVSNPAGGCSLTFRGEFGWWVIL